MRPSVGVDDRVWGSRLTYRNGDGRYLAARKGREVEVADGHGGGDIDVGGGPGGDCGGGDGAQAGEEDIVGDGIIGD